MISFRLDDVKRGILFLILSGISLIISFFKIGNLPIDAAWVAIVLCGIPIIKNAAVALVTEIDIKADLLVSLALIASVIIGEIFAAGEVAFIMTIGAMLEERTVAKARAGIEKLISLSPRTARVLRDGEELIIPAEEVQVGDMIRILAGETIPVDGIITEGRTSIDQAVMTGESLPVDKETGDEVSSGTVNQFGTFEMKATKVGEDSSLQRMIRLVESADAGKAKIVGIADRWATWIVVIALVSAGLTWLISGEIIRAVTILVVFCPCALVLATPTAIMAGIGNAAKFGILIREGDALERLADVKLLAFDKTGTLTYGRPEVIGVESFLPGLSRDELLALAASAERRSEHPLGKAMVAHHKTSLGTLPADPDEFLLEAGRGVVCRTGDKRICAGNPEHLKQYAVAIPEEMAAKAGGYKDKGATVIYVSINHEAAGFIALADRLREDARDVIAEVEKTRVQTVLLTGDNSLAARNIAAQSGIRDVYADCLPETKLEIIKNFQQDGKMVCMVGDGINDAPALKQAFVGIAMGGIGSDIAIDAADIALVKDDIKGLSHLLRLAKKTMGTIRVNLTLSMGLNFAAIILAMTGILNPVVGALVHNVGSVIVIMNSALLLKWKGDKNAFTVGNNLGLAPGIGS